METGARDAGPLVWQPSRTTTLLLSVVSTVVALAAAYGALLVAGAGRPGRRLVVTALDMVLVMVLVGLALLVHEGVHGLAISTYGGKPRFAVSFVVRVVPYLYWTAPGQRFSRRRYAIVVLAPTLFVSLALLVGLRSDAGELFVIPFGIHLGVCVNDWVVAVKALRESPGSLIEDVAGGILVHPPASVA